MRHLCVLGHKQEVKRDKQHLIENGELAPCLAAWMLSGPLLDGTSGSTHGHATTILRMQSDGIRPTAVDNIWGPAILG